MDMKSDDDSRPACKYGSACYQKNEAHLKRFKHDQKISPAKRNTDVDDSKAKVEDNENGETSPKSPSPKRQKKEEDVPVSAEALDKETAQRVIKKMFLVDMPDDFYLVWDLCLQINSKNPLDAFKDLNLRLVGPFEVMAGILKEDKHSVPATLTHWRYFYDPPEFQTLMCGDDKKQLHVGYYRDDPKEMPAFVAMNCAAEDCIIKECGSNLFAALDYFGASKLKSADTFSKMKIQKVVSAIQKKAKLENIELYDKSTIAARKRKVVCPTFHKGGLVVPVDKTSKVGYRKMETEANLKKILDRVANAESEEETDSGMEAVDSLITYANIANDECDFGGPLELAMNLFSHGHEAFHPHILGLLTSTYLLLNRSPYAEIIKAHISSGRKKGTELSII